METCAHRCAVVEGLVLQVARLTGQDESTVRVRAGLTREYVPPVSLPTCTRCTAVHPSPLSAATCCDD